eukprot:496000_1
MRMRMDINLVKDDNNNKENKNNKGSINLVDSIGKENKKKKKRKRDIMVDKIEVLENKKRKLMAGNVDVNENENENENGYKNEKSEKNKKIVEMEFLAMPALEPGTQVDD